MYHLRGQFFKAKNFDVDWGHAFYLLAMEMDISWTLGRVSQSNNSCVTIFGIFCQGGHAPFFLYRCMGRKTHPLLFQCQVVLSNN
ncbi:MAG: hypothetical protein O4753_06980 [Trichodesmium sp. St7_bin2_1]|nr:hypothetical protein [Trichodesmium sp. St7_bin2_1]